MPEVVVTGIQRAQADLSPLAYDERLGRAVQVASREVLVPAIRLVLSRRRWSGRAEASVRVLSQGALRVEAGGLASVAPELGPVTYGWRSHSGRQPPPERIAGWLASKGRDPGAAFVVARAILERGYRARKLETFRTALAEARSAFDALVARELGARR